MIILEWWTAQGNHGKCDSNCYRPKDIRRTSNRCACICMGDNHGVGRVRAYMQTRHKAVNWVRVFDESRPENDKVVRWTVTPSAVSHMRRLGKCFKDPRFFFTTNEAYQPRQVEDGV